MQYGRSRLTLKRRTSGRVAHAFFDACAAAVVNFHFPLAGRAVHC